MPLMFVYGTLKRGYGNNARCLSSSKFLGEAVTAEPFYEMQNYGFPILFEGNFKASGEIFAASPEDLKMCDRLEGHPGMYCREKRQFVMGNETVTAWVYLWQGEEDGDKMELSAEGVYTWEQPSRRIKAQGGR